MSWKKDLSETRSAYKNKDVEATKKAHEKRIFAKEQHQKETGKYLKSIVYGAMDGIITTFAVVSGVMGAQLAVGVIIILGFANLIADGISMGLADYLSSKSEQEYNKDERRRETWEVENYPDGEKIEMVTIFKEKGVEEQDAKSLINILSKYKNAWIDIMMTSELGIVESEESPLKNGIVTFISFASFGSIPLLSYIVALLLPTLGETPYTSFIIAIVLTAISLFALGAMKTKFTGKNFVFSGLEMLLVGGIAAVAAFFIGFALNGLA